MNQHTPTTISPASFLLASTRAEVASLKLFYRIGDLVLITSNIVHSLQRERGASNMYLGSGGHQFKSELNQLITESNDTISVFHAFLDKHYPKLISQHGKSLWLNQIGTSLYQLDTLIEIRQQTFDLAISTEEIVDIYTKIIGGLLTLVFETVDIVAEPKTANTLITLFHLMHGKESIGQERAIGSAGFAKGFFSNELKERHAQVIENQKQSFKLFAHFAEIDILGAWQAIEHSPIVEQMTGLRRIIQSNATCDPKLSTDWFTTITAWIDALKKIEIKLQLQFKIQIEQLIQSAQASLDSNKAELAALQQLESNDRHNLSVATNQAAEHIDDAGVGKQMRKHIFHMMQEQAYRLEEANQALEAAKNTLNEQKNINRAKALLNTHHKLSENEAHQYMRKLAMNHNKKIADIAIFIIDQFQHIGR